MIQQTSSCLPAALGLPRGLRGTTSSPCEENALPRYCQPTVRTVLVLRRPKKNIRVGRRRHQPPTLCTRNLSLPCRLALPSGPKAREPSSFSPRSSRFRGFFAPDLFFSDAPGRKKPCPFLRLAGSRGCACWCTCGRCGDYVC